MIRWLLILVLIATALPASGPAQSLRVEATGSPTSLGLAMHRGYPAYPATALRSMGAEVVTGPAGARAVLFGDTLVFEAFSPFFKANGKVQQLVAPVYREGGVIYLPHQLFAEWLPARYPDRLHYADGVLRLGTAAATTAAAPASSAANPAPSDNPPPPARPARERAPTRAQPSKPSPKVVIIDPGHGGRDPGRPGPNGLREKDIVLSIAKRLAAELRERGGYEVHLTRTTDTLVALADRPHMANRWKAGRPMALFLSIHANGVSNRSAAGFETFFLSEARTEDERRVAEMENSAVEYEDPTVPDADDLGWILNTLRNDFYMRASNDLAEVIQRHLDRIHPGPNRGVKQAGFRVLVGAFMPAVLVETGFITNTREARLLADASFQQKLSRSLADAVDEFFRTHEHLWTAADGT